MCACVGYCVQSRAYRLPKGEEGMQRAYYNYYALYTAKFKCESKSWLYIVISCTITVDVAHTLLLFLAHGLKLHALFSLEESITLGTVQCVASIMYIVNVKLTFCNIISLFAGRMGQVERSKSQ